MTKLYTAQPAPSGFTAPHADSVTAPHSEPWYGHQFKEVRRGYWQCSCGKAIAEAVPSASKDSYPPLPNRYAYDDDGGEMFTADHMRAYVDADRAARATVDSVMEDAARNYERRYAIRQGRGYAACDAYFDSRHEIAGVGLRMVFRDGFERGWDAALKEGNKP